MQTSPLYGQQHALPPDPCWLEVDLDALEANVRAIRRIVGPATAVAAVVKAEAYGLGMIPVARAAIGAGASCLAIARVDEGIALRRAGYDGPILNLAYLSPAEAPRVIAERITPVVADGATARALAAALPRGATLPIHLKVDTGLTRFGARPEELAALLDTLDGLPSLRLEGLATHFAAADEADARDFTVKQLARLRAAERVLLERGWRGGLRHAANSAAMLSLPESRLDLVRIGILLSGHYPSGDVARVPGLRPAVRFKARVARVYDLPSGTTVGYGRTYRTATRRRAALIPVGYADGLPRSHSNRAMVLLRGRRVPLIGRVSMDQCVVDVTDAPGVEPGDVAGLLGSHESSAITLDEYAGWSGTIGHEALCRIGARVPRYYAHRGSMKGPYWIGLHGVREFAEHGADRLAVRNGHASGHSNAALPGWRPQQPAAP